jgi:hypothetical protein
MEASRRKKIITQIQIMDDAQLQKMEHFLAASQKMEAENALIAKYATPIGEKTDLEALIREQNYQPCTADEFWANVKDLDIQEPIELLLSQLTK